MKNSKGILLLFEYISLWKERTLLYINIEDICAFDALGGYSSSVAPKQSFSYSICLFSCPQSFFQKWLKLPNKR